MKAPATGHARDLSSVTRQSRHCGCPISARLHVRDAFCLTHAQPAPGIGPEISAEPGRIARPKHPQNPDDQVLSAASSMLPARSA